MTSVTEYFVVLNIYHRLIANVKYHFYIVKDIFFVNRTRNVKICKNKVYLCDISQLLIELYTL